MSFEYCEKWEPVEGIITPIARVSSIDDVEGLQIKLIFSEIVGAADFDLLINFGRVPAFTVHEEYVHPWKNEDEKQSVPRLKDEWERYAFPCLIVRNSNWLRTFSDSQLYDFPDCIHYQFLTLDRYVDVLSNNEPQVTWVKAE